MSRLAIITDVHADLCALRDALVQAEQLGCTEVVCAGDVVDYGPFPNETIALLLEKRIPCIRGNHDRWRVGEYLAGRSSEAFSRDDAIGSATELSDESVRFLASLPTAWNAVIGGVTVGVHHASPGSDMDGIYPGQASHAVALRWLERAQAEVLLVGHTHLPFVLTVDGGGVIANPGALLRGSQVKPAATGWVYDLERGVFAPAPSPPGGTFGVLDLPSQRFVVVNASDGSEVEIPRFRVGEDDGS